MTDHVAVDRLWCSCGFLLPQRLDGGRDECIEAGLPSWPARDRVAVAGAGEHADAAVEYVSDAGAHVELVRWSSAGPEIVAGRLVSFDRGGWTLEVDGVSGFYDRSWVEVIA